jgi:4-hydroxy-3-polyprenylbenzoate decarboxylase
MDRSFIVGVTGASGAAYALRLLEMLEDGGCRSTLIATDSAINISNAELPGGVRSLKSHAAESLDDGDLGAWPASGSRRFDGMAVVPCSMSSLSKIASGISDGLVTRTAAVALKERRCLVVVPRETPLSLPMIDAMRAVALAGGVVLPAMPAFYHGPKKIDDMVDFVAARIAAALGVQVAGAPEWRPDSPPKKQRRAAV